MWAVWNRYFNHKVLIFSIPSATYHFARGVVFSGGQILGSRMICVAVFVTLLSQFGVTKYDN